MRRPTRHEVLSAWHTLALSGLEPPRHEDDPQPGWYRIQRVKKGPWIPLLIHLRQVVDPETGELEEPEELVAELDGEPIGHAELLRLWLWARPITRTEFDSLRRLRAASPDMAATHVRMTADALALGPAPRR